MSHRALNVDYICCLVKPKAEPSICLSQQRWLRPPLEARAPLSSRPDAQIFKAGIGRSCQAPSGALSRLKDEVVLPRKQDHYHKFERRYWSSAKPSGYNRSSPSSAQHELWNVWNELFKRLHPSPEDNWALAHDSFAAERAEASVFVEQKSIDEIRCDIEAMSEAERSRAVPRILAGSLTTSAAQTLYLLAALPSLGRGFDVSMDCLLFLKRVHWEEVSSDAAVNHEYVARVMLQCRNWNGPLSRIRHKHFVLLLEHCTPSQITALVERSLESNSEPGAETMLALVDYYTRHRDHTRAIHALKMLPRSIISASDRPILQRCTNLLKLDYVERDGASQNFKILPELLESGIRPDAVLHNIITQNAFAAGMFAVGWDLFRHMEAEKVEILSGTYVALLKDTFTRQDVQGLNDVLTAIHQREDIARSPYVVSYTMNIIRIICMFERGDHPEVTFSHMLAIYDRAFSRKELVRLGMVGGLEVPAAFAELPQPDAASLAFAIWSYVLAQRQAWMVNTLWLRLRRHLGQGDTSIVDAATHPFFYDGFILFYSRSPHTLMKCLGVIQHMLDHDFCQPTEKTWTFLIYAFLRHGHEQAANRIRAMMTERKVSPSGKAWGRILQRWPESDVASYAREALDGYERKTDHHVGLQSSTRAEDADVMLEGPQVAVPRSETVYRGWNEMIDLRSEGDPMLQAQ